MRSMTGLLIAALALALPACGGDHDHPHPHPHGEEAHTDEGPDARGGDEVDGHEHEETSLGTIDIGGLSVELAQGHGTVAAGEEGLIVVKLPYSDSGATIVRAWIGTEDRTASMVGKGEYHKDHDDYDVHATAPDPLPEDAMWWIEIEKPDGTRLLGSATPLFE